MNEDELKELEDAFLYGNGVQISSGLNNEWTDITVFDSIKKFLKNGYTLRIKPNEE